METVPQSNDSKDTIVVTLEPTNVRLRFPCYICGGTTDKEPVLARFVLRDHALFVCRRCIEEGPEGWPLSLERQLDTLEWEAVNIRTVAALSFVAPSYEEFLAAETAANGGF